MPKILEEVASVENMKFVCAPGYPMSGGTVARTVDEAYFVKASIGSEAHTIKPMQRERYTAAAVVVPVRVQTADLPCVPSALTRERRT